MFYSIDGHGDGDGNDDGDGNGDRDAVDGAAPRQRCSRYCTKDVRFGSGTKMFDGSLCIPLFLGQKLGLGRVAPYGNQYVYSVL